MFFKLKYLNLSNNYLIGSLPSFLSNLTRLKVLDVSYNQLTGNLPSSLGGLTQLRVLDVSYNELTSNLTRLQVLDVFYNELTGNLPSSLGNITQLQLLDVSYNGLTGNLLSNLVDLDLSSNLFNGSIPVFKNCSGLNHLDLSNNSLSGHIPEELGHCASLEFVNFRHNNLGGSIPYKFLCSSHLADLYLSHNNLYRPTPSTNISIRNERDKYYDGERTFLCESGGLTSSKRKSHLLVVCIVLSLFIGLSTLILAFVLCCQHTPVEDPSRINVRNGDFCSIWNFDGHIAYEDIMIATNNFDIRYCIGTGGYGSVYEARLPSGKTVALKKLHRLEAEEPTFDRSFRNEAHVLSNIRHKNIVKLFGFCLHNRSMFLVYEFMEKGSLFCALRDDAHAVELDWSKRVNIVKGISHALSYMHHDCAPPIVHRDISSNNILLNSEMEAFVADFGASRLLEPDSSNQTIVAGTCGYIAPGYLFSLFQKFSVPHFYVVTTYYP
uniref:non-specific serine/threonine protein kinase n=1 Tax=Daucus carota subsp. sativus TaxID=79200 RepID=A0A166DB81_DAUCS